MKHLNQTLHIRCVFRHTINCRLQVLNPPPHTLLQTVFTWCTYTCYLELMVGYCACFLRCITPQRRSHSSTRHFPSRGSSHRLGSPWSHLQGPVAAAHPLHSCCAGEVRVFTPYCSFDAFSPSASSHRPLLVCVVRYNVVFRYLLSVRRVQSQLQHCWALQMQRKHLKSSQTDAVKWRLRNHMAFLIDNLQYYLQVTMQPRILNYQRTRLSFNDLCTRF